MWSEQTEIMKTNPILMLTILLLDILLSLEAQAFYNPSTGRWLSRDPIEENGGLNVFGFVENRPTTRIDRFGLAINDLDPTCNLANFCCDGKTINAGFKMLTERYLKAANYLRDHGAIPDATGNGGGVSCIGSANVILTYMSPIPRCWSCHIQRRWGWVDPLWEENSILCELRTKSGSIVSAVVFDWFFQEEHKMKFRGMSPPNYNFFFPKSLSPSPSALYTKSNPAPHEECWEYKPWRDEIWRINALLPAGDPWPRRE